METREALIKAY